MSKGTDIVEQVLQSNHTANWNSVINRRA